MSPHSSVLAGKSHGHRRLAGYSPWGSNGVGRYEPLAPTKPVRGVGCSTAPACGPRLEESSPVQKQLGLGNCSSSFRSLTRQERLLAVLLSVKWSLSVPQKWKQLSRLQRMVVLFLLVVLMLFGLRSYVHVADEWAGTSCMILGRPEGCLRGGTAIWQRQEA